MNKLFAPFLPPWAETGLQPAFYDLESGTVLQQTARMYDKVNQLIRLFNELSEETQSTVNEYITKFTELKDFVDTYFDNLDVQEEINNKLDEMAEDGTLLEILLSRDFEENTEIYFKTAFVKSKFIDGMPNINGGCVLPDNSIIQCSGLNTFYHYGADGTLLNSNTIEDTGHCNGCCYNSKTGKVYIVGSSGTLTNKVMVLNPVTLTIEETIDASANNYPSGAYGIVYNEDADEYIMCNWWGDNNTPYIWKVDNEFNLLQSVDTGFNDIKSTSNIGRFGKYVGINNMYTHQMFLFDMNDLSFYKTLTIDNLVGDTWVITEEEWFDTRSDGKVVLAFHAGGSANPHTNVGTYVYSIYDPIRNYEVCPIKDAFPPKDEFYRVDHTYTGNDRNGTASAPFNNIYEALNSSLRTKRCTGKVTIRFSNNTQTIYTPVFMMNKSYILWNPSRTIDFLGAIAVNSGCSVMSNRPINLKLLESKINPFDEGLADIHCNGSLIIQEKLTTPNNVTPTIVGSGFFKAQFEDCGLDVGSFYGDVECTGNGLYAVDHVIQNNRLTYNTTNFCHQYKGIKGGITANGNGEFIIPALSKSIMLVIKVTIGSNTYEPSILWNPNTWVTYPIYDETAGKIDIVLNTNGKINLSSSNGGTINRVKIVSL